MNRPAVRFRRLSVKFIGGVILILVFTLALSLFVNGKVVGRYYLRSQTKNVGRVGELLKEALDRGEEPDAVVAELEASEKVFIAYERNTVDYDGLSQSLRDKFREKGVGFQKYWLWDQDYATAMERGSRFRIYEQERMNYGILVEYLPVGENLYAVAAIVPSAADFAALAGRFQVLVYAVAAAVAALLIWGLVRHITRPLKQMEEFSLAISRREYGAFDVRTGDELEVVARSMNRMSRDIRQYQRELLEKNRQMEQLLDNVAHDLKTPISLVGMYAAGIRDGLDDGTFLETIIRQNEKMARMTEALLGLSRIGQKEYPKEELRLDRLLRQVVGEQEIFAGRRNMEISCNIPGACAAVGNEELIRALFSNLLSNAVKYAAGGEIEVSLEGENGRWRFSVSNQVGERAPDLNRIWEPFYVGEESRNKELSGTGLGLAIVRRIGEQCGYAVDCRMEGDRIWFTVEG